MYSLCVCKNVVCSVDPLGDFTFKLIDFDNACRIDDLHPGGFSRGYVSPEVYLSNQRKEAKRKTVFGNANAADERLDIKASIVSDIFSLGLLLSYLASVYVDKRGGRHGNYTVLPVKLESDSKLQGLLSGSQKSFDDYILGADGSKVEKRFCLEIVRAMIALDPGKRTQSLKEVLRSLDVSITEQSNRITELRRDIESLQNDKQFMQKEIIDKMSEFGNYLHSAFGNLEVTLREMVHEIPDNSQYLEQLSGSVGQLVDGLQRASEQGDKGLAKEVVEALRRSLEENAQVQKELASESHAQLAVFSGVLGTNDTFILLILYFIIFYNIL